MNYYKRHIGDYAAATRHLSILEHGVYMLAMDFYYTTEGPLPIELKEVCRKLGARSKEECAAVDSVLKDFFTLTDAGWTQARCDAEVGDYQRKVETNRVVGSKGGRPKKQTNAVDSENPEITQTVSDRNPQETLTSNREPITNNQIQGAHVVIGGDARAIPNPGDVCKAMKAVGMASVNPSSPKLVKLLAAGVTEGELVQAAVDAVAQGKAFAYALATAEGRRADAQQPAKSRQSAEPSWRTEQRNRTLQAVPGVADHGVSAQEFFDVEAKNVTAVALG